MVSGTGAWQPQFRLQGHQGFIAHLFWVIAPPVTLFPLVVEGDMILFSLLWEDSSRCHSQGRRKTQMQFGLAKH